MIPRRTTRSVAAGLLLSLFVLGGFVGLLGAAPASLRSLWRHSPVTPNALTPQLPSEPAPPSPGSGLAAAPCHVVGTPFAITSSGDEAIARVRIQNVGSTTATLHALQLGWSGPATLTEIDVAAVPVFAGSAASPALVKLTSIPELELQPAQTLELELHFALAGPSAPWNLIQAIGLFGEGCMVALGPVPANPCRLEIAPATISPDAPRRVAWVLANGGPGALELATLDLTWPEATNGVLVGLTADGAPLLDLETDPAHAPAVLDLRRLLKSPLVLAPDEQVVLGLEFAQDAAAEPYTLVAATATGCSATRTDWLANPDCGVQLRGLVTLEHGARLEIANQRAISRTLTSLDIFWPVEATGALTTVLVNGMIVWSGVERTSPASIALQPGVTIGPAATAGLHLVFLPTNPAAGPTPTSPTGGEYSVVAGFEHGCAVAFSTLRGPVTGCTLSSGELEIRPSESAVQVNLVNMGASAVLRRLAIAWPARNGALIGVTLGATQLFAGSQAPGREPFDLPLARNILVGQSASETLRLSFSRRVSRQRTVLALSFQEPGGQPCADLMVSSPETALDCKLSFGTLAALSQHEVEIELTNAGQDEVEIRNLSLDWPASGSATALREVVLVDAAGSRVIWSGMQHGARAQLLPNGPIAPIVDGGATVRLRFRFDQLNLRPGPPMGFKITVGFVEGCEVSYAPEGVHISPQRVTFGGVIRGLPSGGSLLGCCWTIQTGEGDRLIAVDGNTRLVPSSVKPSVGDIVVVQALSDEERLYAEEISFRTEQPPVTVIGKVEELDPAEPPSWIVVVGRTITILAETIIDGQLRLGARVTVTGVANDEGGVTASQIEVKDPPVGEPVLIEGIIQATVERAADCAGDPAWDVDQYRVCIGSETDIRGSGVPSPGRQVEVKGALTDQVIRAREVTIRPEVHTEHWMGIVVTLPTGGVQGTWEIATQDGPRQFVVESPETVDTRVAPARVGMRVRVTVQDQGVGRFVAVSARMDWPE